MSFYRETLDRAGEMATCANQTFFLEFERMITSKNNTIQTTSEFDLTISMIKKSGVNCSAAGSEKKLAYCMRCASAFYAISLFGV